MSDTGTGSHCTICVTNNGDIANVDKDFDLTDISVSNEGTSKQRQFKTGVPQGGALSPTLFNIYTSDLPPPSAPVQVMAYADDITITSTHTSTSAAKKFIQPYLHKIFAWTKQNNLLLNPDKTTCTLFTPSHHTLQNIRAIWI